MKSLVMKSIYTGLGLLGSGKETVEQLGRKLAKQANVSEKDGERIARELQTRSQKAITAMQKTLHSEVNKVVSAMRAATKEMSAPPTKKRTAKRRRS